MNSQIAGRHCHWWKAFVTGGHEVTATPQSQFSVIVTLRHEFELKASYAFAVSHCAYFLKAGHDSYVP